MTPPELQLDADNIFFVPMLEHYLLLMKADGQVQPGYIRHVENMIGQANTRAVIYGLRPQRPILAEEDVPLATPRQAQDEAARGSRLERPYRGAIEVGDRFTWEPFDLAARAGIKVTAKEVRGGELWIQSEDFERPQKDKVWNDESRFREACVPYGETKEREAAARLAESKAPAVPHRYDGAISVGQTFFYSNRYVTGEVGLKVTWKGNRNWMPWIKYLGPDGEEECSEESFRCFIMPPQTADADRSFLLSIWWTNQEECEAVGEKPQLPFYMEDQWHQRWGRPGRGRLWVSQDIDFTSTPEFDDDNPLHKELSTRAGIVLKSEHVEYLRPLRGIVTDTKLRYSIPLPCPTLQATFRDNKKL